MKLEISARYNGTRNVVGTYKTIGDVTNAIGQQPMTYEQLKDVLTELEEKNVETHPGAGPGYVGLVSEDVVRSLLGMGMSPNNGTKYTITLQK